MLGVQNIVSTFFLAESRPEIELLSEQLLALFQREEDKQAVSLLLNWYRQLAIHGYVTPDDYTSLAEVYRSEQEVKGMLQTTFKKQQEQWYQEGLEQGIEKGIRLTARTMLARGIDPVLVAEVTGLSQDELNALLTAPPPDDVTR